MKSQKWSHHRWFSHLNALTALAILDAQTLAKRGKGQGMSASTKAVESAPAK